MANNDFPDFSAFAVGGDEDGLPDFSDQAVGPKAPDLPIPQKYYDDIKRIEGFSPVAKWDYKQNTNGYGTRALHPGERIDEAEAERRYNREISKAAASVDAFLPGLPEGVRASLASLTFNSGDKWQRMGLGAALKAGDMEEAGRRFNQYVNAGGKPLGGLINRRAEEYQWWREHQTSDFDSNPETDNPDLKALLSAPPEKRRELLIDEIENITGADMSAYRRPKPKLDFSDFAVDDSKPDFSAFAVDPGKTEAAPEKKKTLPFGMEQRSELLPGEDKYFKSNLGVAGMAAEDGKVILNPYSKNKPEEQDAVARNEAARLYMRNNEIKPSFALTKEQRAQFAGTPYANDEQVMRETIAAHIFSGDPSAKTATQEQKDFVESQLKPVSETGSLGYGEELWRAIKRGTSMFGQQFDAFKSMRAVAELKRMQAAEERIARGDVKFTDPADMAYASMSPEARKKSIADLTAQLEANVKSIAERVPKIESIPPSPIVAKALDSKSFSEFWDHFKQDPVRFIGAVGVESLPQMVPGVVAATGGGFVAGPPGAMVGMGLGSFGTDFMGEILGGLSSEGVDVKDPAAVKAALQNPEIMAKLKKRAGLHAVVVGALDAASAGVASKTLAPKILSKTPIAREVTNIAAQLPVQGTLGAAGEVGGSLASGQEINPGEVGAEFFGEFIGAPAEVAGIRSAVREGKGRAPEQVAPPPGPQPPQPGAPQAQAPVAAGPTPAAQARAAGPSPAKAPVPSEPVGEITPEDIQLLIERGWKPDALIEMGEDELRAEIEDARAQVGTPLAPNAPRQADFPSAEPVSDIEAQILSMRAGERDGVYLSADNVENLQSQPEFVNRIAEALNSVDGAKIVQNVDGKGGIMVAANADVARNIEKAVKSGVDVQTVLGEATGAGTGKAVDATAVVQQKTPEGAVTRESLVTPDQVAETEKEFAQPGKTVETVTPEQAIARREEKIAEEKQTGPKQAGPMVSRVPTFKDIAETLPKDKDGDPDYKALSDRIADMGKKGWPDLNVMEKAKLYREFAGQGTGTRNAPVAVETADDLDFVSHEADSEYTPAQGEANNRKLGHAKWNGLDLSIETKAGGVRKGVDKKTGKTWETTMGAAYGYIRGTSGADNMHVDVFVGPDVNSDRVFVIDEVDNRTGKFRQHKTFVGFPDEESAIGAYTRTSSKTPDMIGAVTEMSADDFRDWVLDGKKTEPLGNIEKPDFSALALESESPAKPAEPASETIAPPARYDGEPLSEMEIDAIVGNWKYVQEVSRRPRPQSLSSYVIDNGGLRDDAREVRHIAGSAKERPGLVNAKGQTLDDAALSALEAGFFHGDRPDIADFLDALQNDLHSGKVVREQDLPALDDLRIAEDIEQEIADYGVTTNRFRSEASLREYFGQKRPRTARETETAEKAQAPAKERASRAGEEVEEEAPFDLPAKAEKAKKPFDPYKFSVQAVYAKQGEEALKKRLAEFGIDELKQIVSAQNLGVNASVLDGGNAIALRKAIVEAAREKLANRMAAAGGTVEGALKKPAADKVEAGVTTEASGQTSLVPEPTTKDKIAAQTKAKEKKGGNEPMDEGLFGSSKDQLDLVDMAKQPEKETGKVETKADKAETKTNETETKPEADNLPDALRDRLLGEGFATIIEARKFAKDFGFEGSTKDVDELVEQAVVAAAKQLVSETGDVKAAYQALVDLYNKQPNLAVRTSTSVTNQAYSTPAPLAYLASRLAGVANANRVLEPTAGNGMLLIEAEPNTVEANEIDPKRAQALRDQNFATVKSVDATEPSLARAKSADSVIMNPPFGAVREDGQSKSWTVDGLETSAIDHAIALNALHAMTDDGKAVIIMGGVNAESIEERRKGYRGKSKRLFFAKLYKTYNVTDHFTVSGDLYKKQGAGWPVDVVVIEGRGQSERPLPASEPPVILKSWEDLKGKLPDVNVSTQGSQKAPVGDRRQTNESDRGKRGSEGGNGPRSKDAGGRGTERLPGGTENKPADVRGNRDSGKSADVRDRTRHENRPAPESDRNAGTVNQPAAPRKPRLERTPPPEGSGQALYEPASDAQSLNTLIPVNMQQATQAALRRIEKDKGNLDQYVADNLGYDVNELSKYFSAEQVDAIASAISNIEKGSAQIIGDQTGIGKGRVVAATIRYAIRKGWTPIFVTEKIDLYGDMFRDMADIGLPKMLGHEPRAFMTNTGESVPLDEEALAWKQEADQARADDQPIPKRRGRFLTAGGKPAQDMAMAAIVSGKGEYDIVFTTYDQMNPLKKQETDRRHFLRQINPNSLLILDESHVAGGQGEKKFKPKHGTAPDRAEFVRGLVKDAAGVVYSSATYAKRPDVMDLYARTDMGKAVDDPKLLPALIQKGGVPMQQIVASMLSNAGQYMRRERSFEGVEYAIEPVPVDEKTYKQFTDAVRSVFEFDLAVEDIRDEVMKDILDKMGATKAKDAGVGSGSASSTAFASIMHNIVNQMLLSIKARQVAQRAIDAHKAGEKPVIALASTMEKFISDYAEDAGIAVGQNIDITFGDVLAKYLSRTLRITVKDSENKTRHVQIPLSDLPPSLQRKYAEAEQLIKDGDFDLMPASPIDAIRHELTRAGLKVAEVTGRKKMIDYAAGNMPRLVDRPKSEMGPAGKRSSIAAFNRGGLDALILNRSGSTGVSMHASKAFKDQSPRRMIIAQAEANIDTHLQMLGRVHRTGQVIPPSYSQIAAEIPAEARPTAVLMKKMASLNANTTGARGSVFMADAVDFMNEYGDKVVANIINDDPEINAKLGSPLKENDKGLPVSEDAARNVTGRLVLLSPQEQTDLLNRIQDEYKAEIERLDALGENALEAKTVDLRAKVLDTTTLKDKTGEGPFLDSAQIEKVSVKAQGRAMAPGEVVEAVAKGQSITSPDGEAVTKMTILERSGRDWMNKKIGDVRSRSQSWIAADVAAKSDDAKVSTKKRHDDQLTRWIQTAQVVAPGARVTLQLGDRQMQGIVLSVERTGKAKNPVALGAWTATVAVPDSVRTISMPFSQLFPPSHAKGGEESGAEVKVSQIPFSGIISQLEDARREGREERYIVTGNILAGYDQVHGKGQIVNFTMEDGTLRPGILMSRDFQLNKFMNVRTVRFKTAAQVATFLEKAPMAEVQTSDKYVRFVRPRGEYVIETAAGRATGGQYYTDTRVRDALKGREFVRSGGVMRVTMSDRAAFERVVEAIRKVGGIFETTSDQDLAQEIIRQTSPLSALGGDHDPQAINNIERRLVVGREARIAPSAVQFALEAIKNDLKLAPANTIVAAVSKIATDAEHDGHVLITATKHDGKTVTARLPWDRVKDSRAIFIPGRRPTILHINFRTPPESARRVQEVGQVTGRGALDEVAEMRFALAESIRADFIHELTHLLRTTGVLTGSRWQRLLDHANSLQLLELDVNAPVSERIMLRELGVEPRQTLRDAYSRIYAHYSNAQEAVDQEAVAALREMAWLGLLSDEQLAPVRDILDEISDGNIRGLGFNESGGPAYAIGKSQSDQDALGYTSALLRGAYNLKQEKGTPEQMLAQLRQQADVKAAEIEATGLDKFLANKKSITQTEIITYLGKNKVILSEVVRGRDGDTEELEDRMEEWRDKQRAMGRFDEERRTNRLGALFESERALNKAVGVLRDHGVNLDFGAIEDDSFNAIAEFEKAGVKVTQGEIPVWSDADGTYFIVEAKDGTAWSMSEFGGVFKRHASKVDAIAELESTTQKVVRDLLAQESDVREILKADMGSSDETKWSAHSIDPINPTYSETVLHLPGSVDKNADFRSGHFNEPNIVAHLRTVILADDKGRKILDADELQSDWAQAIRDRGARDGGPPISHPLVNTTDQWTTTAIRRLIKMAVDNGVDGISFTPGRIQAARYNLAKHVRSLEYDPTKNSLYIEEINGSPLSRAPKEVKSQADLERYVGKAVAKMLLDEPRGTNGAKPTAHKIVFKEGQVVGGEGMKATYDVMYPRLLGKLLAKMDTSIKPEKANLFKHDGNPVRAPLTVKEVVAMGLSAPPAEDFTVFPITDKVRSQVLNDGQMLFAIGGRGKGDPVSRYIRWAEKAKPATLSITDKIGKAYRFERKPVGNGSIYYKAFDGAKEVASFYVRTGGAIFDSISVMNAIVERPYRRLGIASAAYDAIEADTAPGGLPLYPQGSLSMSQDALAFWEARNPDRLAEMRDTEIQPFGRTVASIYASKVDATSKDQIETAIQDALEIVGRIAGRNINVDLKPTIPVGAALDASSRADLEASGQDLPETAGGYYKTVRNGTTGVIEGPHVIGLAFEDPRFDLRTTAGHEAWHHVETALSTPQEMRLLQSPAEMARMTRLAAKEAGRSTAETSRLPAYEIRALAFQNYRRMREEGAAELSGLHIGVRRFFERVAKTLAAVRNALNGMGYTTFEDIFERARTGETAAKAARQEAGAKEQKIARVLMSVMQSSSNNNPDPAATINAFIDQRMARDDGNAASQVQAYHAYSLWADEAGLELPTIEEFDKAMLRQGVRRMVLANDDVRYIGLRVVEEAEEKPANPSAKIEKDAFQIAKELALGMSIEGAIEKQIEKVKSVIGEKPDFARLALLQTLKANDNANEKIHENIISMGNVMPSNPLRGTLHRRALRMLARVANISDAARVRIQDKALPIRRLAVERVENETGAAVPVSLDTYISEGLYHGRAGERLNDLKQDRIEPLLEHMRASGLTLKSVGDYLYARHAFERNDAIRQIDPDNDAGSGMTDEEAATILDRVYQSGKQADMDTAVRMVDTIIDDARNTLLRSGLIDRTTYDKWRDKYPNYVPLRGFDLGEDENPDRPRAGRGFDLRGAESKQALGRRSKSDNPLVYTIMQAEEAIIRAEKNRVAKTLYRMIQANPNPAVWELYRGEAKRRVNPSTGLVETYWVRPPFVHNDAVHGVKFNGKQFWMELKNPALARAMRGVGSEWNGSIIGRAMMTLTRTYASLLTSYNPEFVVSNFFRDLETSLMNVSDVANKPAGLRRQILKDATSLKSIRGALAAIRDYEGRTIFGTKRFADENILGLPKSAGAQEYARWYDEFRLAGGKISFMEFNDVERIKHRINADLKAGRMKRALRGAAEYVENLNTAVENGVRLSTYVALRRSGVHQDKAAFTARELTVNFNRRGEWGPAINSMYLFFNASVQGSTRVAQAFVRSKAVRYGVASIFAAGMALDLFNFLAAGDGDDGENKYDAIPDWIKERNVIIMNPFGDDYIMIPMTYGYNVPYVAGLKATEMVRGKTSPLQAAASVAGQVVDSFNPMGTAASFYQLVSPTLLDPAVQVLENKTWYGGPIYPTLHDKRKPESENYFTSAPWWAVGMAKTLNSMSGGNSRRPGWFDVSPEVIEHYAEFAGGGVAKFVANAINSGERLISGDEWLPEKTPFLRRVYGRPTSEGRKRDFYEMWDEVNQAHYEAVGLAKDGDREGARAAREKYAAELRVYGAAKGAKKTLKALRGQRDRIKADGKLDHAERQAKLNDIIEREKALISRVMKLYRDAKSKQTEKETAQ